MLQDRANLERFRAGDRATLGDVYRAYMPLVAKMARHGFLFSSQGESHRFRGFTCVHDQQNLIQETFVRALSDKARASYDGLTPYEAYLRGIARNLVIDMFRSRTRAMTVFDGSFAADEIDEVPSDGPDAGDEIDREAIALVVRGFVETLPVIEKRFVDFRYTRGLTQLEVAKKMKVGRSRVRTLENRVRAKLEKALQQAGVVEAAGGKGARAAQLMMVALS